MKCEEALEILFKKFKREHIDFEIMDSSYGDWGGLYFPREHFGRKNVCPKILIHPDQTLMKGFLTCLHEYGHHKTHLKNKLKGKRNPNYCDSVTLEVINHEVLAWQEGWKVAKRIGITENKKFCKAFFEDTKYSVNWYVSRFVKCPKSKIFE
jgi:hypothetical protein